MNIESLKNWIGGCLASLSKMRKAKKQLDEAVKPKPLEPVQKVFIDTIYVITIS